MDFFKTAAKLIPEYGLQSEHPVTRLVTGLSHIHKAHYIASADLTSEALPLLALVENENTAVRLCEDVTTFGGNAAVYPAKDFNLLSADTQSSEYEHRRLAVLSNLPDIIIATPEAAAQFTVPEERLTDCIIDVSINNELNVSDLLEKLVRNGYTRVDMVETLSQFSVRGSVIDIYPVNGEFPVRIDLWGDTVESVSLFDVTSQRSVGKVDTVTVSPAVELAEKETATLFDYVQSVVLCEQNNCNEQFRAASEQLKYELETAVMAGKTGNALQRYMLSKSEYESVVGEKAVAVLSTFGVSGGVGHSGQLRIEDAKHVTALSLPAWNGDYAQLRDDLRGYVGNGYAVVVFAGTEKSARSLALSLHDDGLPCDYSANPKKVFAKHIFVTEGTLSGGFDYPMAKCACITHLGISRVNTVKPGFSGGNSANSPNRTTSKTPKKKNKSEAIRALTEINIGDYIVHDNYGIGIFEGVTKITNDGVSKDYIQLKYAGKDVLYVPVTQLDFIARYIGNTDNDKLKLSKLNTDTWFKTRQRTKKAVEELAEALIELYAKRMRSKGHKFSRDSREQEEFEARFSYIETDDQLVCIEQLKKDMQSSQPMDRLLCGDVGFGKTEVALRGAFKCVMEGMQCALLCPTTVLAWQHYQTAVQRMDGFPVNIELLSRFRTAAEKRKVLQKLEAGIVDFVIGTHTLVGKSVKFNNLGLVIIDEEQRFGVTQKERLKEAFTGVDVLTLSATPIPRTLNMAMSGIRDMSVIETPPHDRQPVTTYVTEHDMGVIAAAVNKELRRAGQVYYIHNRVETIVSCAAKLQELVPEAKIGIAHGRMEEHDLLNVWRQLLEREIDVLVCTTLIETGVDVPNVNTLIIENADRMGLAQLHQLRGRVGRTNRRAYAYFTYTKGKMLTEIATKRLEAVKEFTSFGAGFKIALRDLEIRGAGSVLGESQSGHLSAVGYETYVRLLEEAVNEARNGRVNTAIAEKDVATAYFKNENCVVELKTDAFIPESYISNQSQRISCYKRIAEIRDDDDSLDVVDELTDRYGIIPKPVKGLIYAANLRNMGSRLGLSEITQNKNTLTFYWPMPDMERFSRLPHELAARIELTFAEKTSFSIKLNANDDVMEIALIIVKALTNEN